MVNTYPTCSIANIVDVSCLLLFSKKSSFYNPTTHPVYNQITMHICSCYCPWTPNNKAALLLQLILFLVVRPL